MGLFNLFARPTPEKLEEKGDALFRAKQWGPAKLEYEHALELVEQNADPDAQERITGKLVSVKEALAQEHLQNAENLIEGGFWNEAQDLLALALELSVEGDHRHAVEQQVRELQGRRLEHTEADEAVADLMQQPTDEPDHGMHPQSVSDEEYFMALCGTLPEEVGDAYLSYGENFKAGYLALNRGDFDAAAQLLSRAMEEHPDPESYISLELASAYVNLDQPIEAQRLLENFLTFHPTALPAYRLLCDIYWEQENFQRVDTLLATVPKEFAESLAIVLLRGETMIRSGNIEGARAYLQDCLDKYGWNEALAKELAKSHEALGDPSRARALYKEVIDTCTSCRAQVDPEIKHKYAELSFHEGVRDSVILELYLSLAREIPENAAVYFDRISNIYASRGNAEEALRFRSFSERAKADLGHRS